jgi:hypothetical protein
MLSILDLKPRPEEKPDAKPAPDVQRGPVTGDPPPLNTAKSGTTKSPEAQPAAASMRSAAPATPSEAVKSSAQPASSETAKAPPPKPRAESVPVSEPVNVPEAASVPPAPRPGQGEEGEFELVLGRRHIASWLFVGTVLIAIFSAAAYFVGKTSALSCIGALADQTVPYVAPPLPAATIMPPSQEPNPAGNVSPPSEVAKPASVAAQSSVAPQAPTVSVVPSLPTGSAGSAVAPAASGIVRESNAQPPRYDEPPIFAQPQPGALYLQMGAVDKGVGIVLAEGLRKHGFTAFVAPGPSEKIFRVLIGPLANLDAYKRAKAEVDAIDLNTFARRYQN